MSVPKYGTYEESSSLLMNSAKLAQETHEIAELVVEDMQDQGSKLEETRSYLGAMRELTDVAKGSIKSMRAKAQRKRFYLWVAIISLGIANVLVIVQLIRNHGSLFSQEQTSN